MAGLAFAGSANLSMPMRILAVDQARNGAWCVFDYEKKEIVAYDSFSFPTDRFQFEDAVVGVCDTVETIISKYDISAVFIEDVQLRANADSFKKLAQLQGALIYSFKKHEHLFDIIAPSTWQNYCGARGRTTKEIKAKVKDTSASDKKASKVLSIQFVRDNFGIETDNDNIADSICIGYWVVNHVKIQIKE